MEPAKPPSNTGVDELASRRTGLAFQRTRMSADRTLMAVIRTSLALITFGFTLSEVLWRLKEQNALTGTAAARNFGVALTGLGVGMLILGILYHVQFMLGLRVERAEMKKTGYIHADSHFPPSLTLITAVILLLIGIAAILSMVFNVGPFG